MLNSSLINREDVSVRWKSKNGDERRVSEQRQVERIGFGGGCHWCTEAVFQHLRGVRDVEQGFIASEPPHDALSEAVQLLYAPEIIALRVLVSAHLHTHSSTSDHSMRHTYRSAVYVTSEDQRARVERVLSELAPEWDDPLVTRVLSLERFELNDARFLDFYSSRPNARFCRVRIEPKLDTLRTYFLPYVITRRDAESE